MNKEPAYAPSLRLNQVRGILGVTGGADVYEIAERLGVSKRTAWRYMKALQDEGAPVYSEEEGRRTVWRLTAGARISTVTLSTRQMVSLFLARRVFDFLQGTVFKEDLDDVFQRLETTLKKRDANMAKNLGRKFFDVNEAPHVFDERFDFINDAIEGLLREERLSVRHIRVGKGKRAFIIEPYTLLVYKKGLYLVGFSHEHGERRTFGLDGFSEIEWRRNDKFVYPPDYEPARLVEGNFGLIGGAPVRVRIFFVEEVARYIRRQQWHPTQRLKKVKGGLELTMDVNGTVELATWIVGHGPRAKVLEPESLANQVRDEHERAARLYG